MYNSVILLYTWKYNIGKSTILEYEIKIFLK